MAGVVLAHKPAILHLQTKGEARERDGAKRNRAPPRTWQPSPPPRVRPGRTNRPADHRPASKEVSFHL